MSVTRLMELAVGNQPAPLQANNAGLQLVPANTKGTLIAVIVTNSGATWTVNIYDGTSTGGRLLTSFVTPAETTYLLLSPFDNGLFVTASGTTPGDISWAIGYQ